MNKEEIKALFEEALRGISDVEADYWIPKSGNLVSAYDGATYPAVDMVRLSGIGFVHKTQVDKYYKCIACNKYHLLKEDTLKMSSGEGYICNECYRRNSRYKKCNDCGEIIDVYQERYASDSNGKYYCVLCKEHYSVCDQCGIILNGDEREHGGRTLCPSCYRDVRGHRIRGYEHTTSSTLYKMDDEPDTDRYFGIELEIGGGGYDNDDMADHIYTELDELVVCKSDSSVSNGFEIATMPMTYKKHLSYKHAWDSIFDRAYDEGFESNEDVNCGMHIHVSRKAFGATPEKINENIDKLLYIFEGFWSEVEEFSRRDSSQISDWCNRYLDSSRNMTKKKVKDQKDRKRGDRYMAVNLTNSRTIEFRIFNGTLELSVFYANLQLVNRLMDIITTMSEDEIMDLTWSDIVSGCKDEMPELDSYGRRVMLNGTKKLSESYTEPTPTTIDTGCSFKMLPVGTAVRIARDLGDSVGGVYVNSAMRTKSECWAKIEGYTFDNRNYRIRFDGDSHLNDFTWNIGMFDTFLLPEGTKVTVVDNIGSICDEDRDYENFGTSPEMEELAGEVVTVSNTGYRVRSVTHKIEEDERKWSWAPYMFKETLELYLKMTGRL